VVAAHNTVLGRSSGRPRKDLGVKNSFEICIASCDLIDMHATCSDVAFLPNFGSCLNVFFYLHHKHHRLPSATVKRCYCRLFHVLKNYNSILFSADILCGRPSGAAQP